MFKTLLNIYTKIVTFTLIGSALYCTLFAPDAEFTTAYVWQLLFCCLLTCLGSLIYREDSLKVTIIKSILHYIWVNIVVLVCGRLFDWYDIHSLPQILAMLILIASIFLIVSAISWGRSVADANLLTDKLHDYQNQDKEDA